jgi:hypothetical protein
MATLTASQMALASAASFFCHFKSWHTLEVIRKSSAGAK